MAGEGEVSEVESAIWMLLVGHLIGRSCAAAGKSNADGWPETKQASTTINARIGLGLRIRES
jgi:hypothetical protein